MKRVTIKRVWISSALWIGLTLLCSGCAPRTAPSSTSVWKGMYTLQDGQTVVLLPRSDGGHRLYALERSQSLLLRPNGDVLRGADSFDGSGPPVHRLERQGELLHWQGPGGSSFGPVRRWREEPFTVRLEGVDLVGKVVWPSGSGPFPGVVLVHGSERSAATERYSEPYLLAAQGVAVAVFDKRGTGRSGGRFTMRFERLARDVNAVFEWFRTQPNLDASRLGLVGYSQGGWVGPLAARQNPAVRFVGVNYGLAVSPLEEDRDQTEQALRDAGFGEGELTQAGPLLGAVHQLLSSGLSEGWDALEREATLHADQAWLRALRGGDLGLSSPFLRYPRWVLQSVGRSRLTQVSWAYDPQPLLEALPCPTLWLLGADDREAPPKGTIAFLERLRGEGHPVALEVYPRTDHGLVEVSRDGGVRRVLGYPAGSLTRMADWIKGLSPEALGLGCGEGNARVVSPRAVRPA